MGYQDRSYYQDGNGGVPPVLFQFPKLTRLTVALIGTCLALFLVQSSTREWGGMERWGALTFYRGWAFTQPWRWVTYQYLHGGASHFFFNMIGLYFFLPTLELLWGWKKALAFYTAGGVFAGVMFGLLTLFVPGGRFVPLIGASGSIFAALGAVALLMPQRQLILLFFPLPIRVAAALFGAFFLLATVADKDFSNAAHLGGLAFGFFAPYLAGPTLVRSRQRWGAWKIQRAASQEQLEQQTVDQILDKVHHHGMNSLSWTERRYLKKATEHQRRRDRERPKVRRAW